MQFKYVTKVAKITHSSDVARENYNVIAANRGVAYKLTSYRNRLANYAAIDS
jgi:hypothetical protein